MVERLEAEFGQQMSFYKLDVDAPIEKGILVQEFGITNPSIVFLVNDGEVVERWYGLLNEEVMTGAIEAYLADSID